MALGTPPSLSHAQVPPAGHSSQQRRHSPLQGAGPRDSPLRAGAAGAVSHHQWEGCTHQPDSFHLHPSHPSLFPSLAQPQKSCGKLTSADLACNARPLGPLVLPRSHEIPSARVTVQRASPALVPMVAAPASLLETQVSGRTRVRGIGVSRARPRELRLPRFPFRRKKKRQLAAGVRLILHKHALRG